MKHLARLFVLSLLIAAGTAAQDTPQAEVFGGYSYLRTDQSSSFLGGAGIPSSNLHGWNVSVAGNVSRWFGVVADFSGHYGKRNLGLLLLRQDVSLHTFTFGPQVTFRANKVSPFLRVLFGGATGSSSGAFSGSNTDFAINLGAGLDVNVNRHIAIRAFQVDALLVPGGLQGNVRASVGVVFKLGSK